MQPPIETFTVTGDFYPNGPPLYTVFTPPPECKTRWFYDSNTTGTVWSNAEHDPSFHQCQPFTTSPGIYSPGVCPSGQEFKHIEKLVVVNPGGEPIHTLWNGMCCSSEHAFKVPSSGTNYCHGQLVPPVTAYTRSGFGSRLITIDSEVQVVADYTHIYWHESDLSNFPSSLSATLREVMGVTKTAGLTTPAMIVAASPSSIPRLPLPTKQTTRESNSIASRLLSSGETVCICVGVLLILILPLFLSCCVGKRRHKRPTQGHELRHTRKSSTSHSNSRWPKETKESGDKL